MWRRKAEERGATVREWRVDPHSGLLDGEALSKQLTEKTQWVFFSHCSNIVGTVNPVKTWLQTIRQRSAAHVFVDAVACAPHRIFDLRQLGVDAYAFSLYKVYGPHQSLMYVKRDLHEQLSPQCHYFNTSQADKLFNPTGPQHAQVAACAGVIDYFQALYRHHFGTAETELPQQLAALHHLVSAHESRLSAPILDYLSHRPDVRLIGKTVADHDRVPTIAFAPNKQSALAVASKMQEAGIGTESGHFYAHRLLSDLGIDPDDGVVRLSLVHYNTIDEVESLLKALDAALAT